MNRHEAAMPRSDLWIVAGGRGGMAEPGRARRPPSRRFQGARWSWWEARWPDRRASSPIVGLRYACTEDGVLYG